MVVVVVGWLVVITIYLNINKKLAQKNITGYYINVVFVLLFIRFNDTN